MATRPKVITKLDTFKDDVHISQWTGLTTTDADGDPIEMPGSNDRTIQFTGAFGVGGTIVMEGSNDGSNWQTLNDPQGNSISKTAAAIESVMELTRYIRPRVTAGDGSTNLTATLLVRRP
jgi:hypothetical protein